MVTTLRFCIISVPVYARLRPNSNILAEEIICCEVVHEVFSRDESSVFVVLFHDDLF